MSKSEVIRCLKCYVAREVFSVLKNSSWMVRSNCSDLRGSADYSASCGGVAKHGISIANRFRPLKRELLRFAARLDIYRSIIFAGQLARTVTLDIDTTPVAF